MIFVLKLNSQYHICLYCVCSQLSGYISPSTQSMQPIPTYVVQATRLTSARLGIQLGNVVQHSVLEAAIFLPVNLGETPAENVLDDRFKPIQSSNNKIQSINFVHQDNIYLQHIGILITLELGAKMQQVTSYVVLLLH